MRGLITVEPGKPVDCMLRYDGIDVRKTDWARAVPDPQAFFVDAQKYIAEKSGFQMTITEKPYAPSPLAAQIEAEADLDNRIPEDAREELMPSTLIALREYDAQKAYFERFIVKIINQGNFAWKQINHVDGMVDAQRSGTRMSSGMLSSTLKPSLLATAVKWKRKFSSRGGFAMNVCVRATASTSFRTAILLKASF